VDTDYVSFAECVYAAFGDRRKVNPAEIALAWEWVQDVGLSQEAVLMLLQHCMAQRGAHFSFKAAEKLAVAMKEAGVTGPEDAEHFLQHSQNVQDGAKKVLSRMGKRRAVTEDELALYEKWIGEWGFEPQAVLDACRETTGGDPSFKYLDGILNRLRAQAEARTGEGMAQTLDQEKEERAKAKEVFSHLGIKLAGSAAVMTYRSTLLGQPHGVLLLAADECKRCGKNKLDDLTALLESWKNRGLTTEAAVREYLDQYREANRALRELFDACGHSGRPTEADRKLYEKWRGWGYGPELLRCAAEQARNAEGGKIAYLDKVLEAWHGAGVTSVEQAQGRRKPQAAPNRKTVSAQQYGQRQYTEAELLAVSDDLIEEARKQRG
jgi:DNA replication protein DnaD